MSNKHFIGKRLFSFSDNGLRDPVSRVTLMVDDNKAVTAGDDTGLELLANCPYADKTLAQALLDKVKGYQYRAFEAQSADLDPAAELGDGITADGVYSLLAGLTDNGDGYPDIFAPGDREEEDEYPEGGPLTRLFNRQIATTRSLISKNSESVQILVERTDGLGQQYAALDVALDEITLTVSGINRDVAALELRADGIEASVSSVQTGLSQTVRIASDGVTITNAAGSKLTIDGGQINAENLNLTGRITFNDLTDGVKNRFGDGLTEEDVYTYIDESLVAAPTIAGGVFKDYDQNVSLYLDANQSGSQYGLILEDDAGEIFSIWSESWSEEVMSIDLRGNAFISLNGGTFYAWGDWNFSNANVTGL